VNVKRSELLKALKQCLPGIESGTAVLEGADLFVFRNGHVHSYNDIISVAVPIKSDGLLDADIEGAVRAEEFYGIINKFTGELITFEANQADKWVLKSGKAVATLTLMAGDFTNRFDNIAPEKKKWQAIPTEFTQGLGVCRMPANKSNISGMYITATDIMSSDGYQVNHFKWNGPELESFWISDASAGELLKVGALSHVQPKGSWVSFKTIDGTTFSVKTLQAEKWPYEKLLTVLETHEQSEDDLSAVFPKELFDAIDRAASFHLNISDSRAVRLYISPKGILVSAERASGSFEEMVDWKEKVPKFDAFELYVSTDMMLFAARRSLSFYIHVDGDTPRLIFKAKDSVHLMSTLSRNEVAAPKPERKAKPTTQEKAVKKSTPGTMYDEEDETLPAKPAKKSVKKTPPLKDNEDDEEEEKPVKKHGKGKKAPLPVEDDDEVDLDDEDEDDWDD